MASKQPTYQSLQSKDDQEQLLHNTEADESQMGDEKQLRFLPSGARQRPRRTAFALAIETYRWPIDIFLLLAILGLLMVLVLRDRRGIAASSWQVGGDFTGAGPKFTTKVVKWGSDSSFTPTNASDFFKDETLAKWNTIMPVNAAVAPVGESFFTTSMTHQLHCLYMMTRIYSGLVSNNTTSFPSDYHSHFLHCVDYLRQGVMCAGDVALEAHDVTDSDDLGPLDGGWSGHHVCKDYGQVISYLEAQIEEGVRVVLPIDD